MPNRESSSLLGLLASDPTASGMMSRRSLTRCISRLLMEATRTTMGGKDSCALIAAASSAMFHEYAKLFTKDGKYTVVQGISRDKLEGLKTE